MANYKCPKCGGKLVRGPKAPSGKVRWMCRQSDNGRRVYCYSTTNPGSPVAIKPSGKQADSAKNPQFKRALGGVKRLVITAAQNATPVHAKFFKTLQGYCRHNNAELVVIPIRYKNPTSRWDESQRNEEVWAEEVRPFLYNQRKKLNENLILMGDIKTRPTAEKPLSGFESITHGESGILGHTKLQLLTVPTPQGKLPKILTTTGACTVPNYTDSKSGKKGEFHHALAACVVEIDGKTFHLRQLNAKSDGSFIDLNYQYQGGQKTRAPKALAVVFGDTHRAFMDPKVEAATFGTRGIVQTMNPEHLVFHDLHDGYAENPHHRLNPFVQLAKHLSSKSNIEREVREDVEWLISQVGKRKGIITSSNHDNFLWRWIADTDWRRDPENAEFYLETALQMVRSTEMQDHGSSTIDPFQYWVERLRGDAPLRCLGRDESFVLGDVELSLHGDMGPNGARGSRQNLRRIGVKTIIGHSHSPGIEEGCYQTGTSTPLRLEYNLGPSSWLNTHCVLYANGKRALIHIIDGKWRA